MNRTIKSVFSLFLIITILCTLAACGEDISGHYTLVKVTSGTTVYESDDLVTLFGSTDQMYLELNNDGTGYMNLLGVSAKMCWEANKIWSEDNGTKATFSVEGNTLTLNLPDTVMVFQK